MPGSAEVRRSVQDEVAERLGQAPAWEGSRGEERRETLQAAFEDGVLDADEVVGLALANNSGLRAILEDLEIARAEIWQASLPSNPMVDAEVKFLDGGGHVLELAVVQRFVDLLMLPRRRQVAREEFERIRAEVAAAALDLAAEARTTYRQLQAQTDLVEVYRSAVDATYFAFEAARRLHAAGNIIELDLLTEQAMHEDAKLALVDAQTKVRQRRESLNALLGIWGPEGERWEVESRLPMPEALDVDGGEVESRVVEASLDLRAARHRLVALGQQAGLSRLDVLLAEGSVGAVAEREADGSWAAGPLLSLSLPVFDFGEAATTAAHARLRRAYERYTELAIRLRRSARSALVQSEASGANSRYLREVVVPLRSRITAQTQLQFNAMQIGVFQLLEARRRELDAARQYITTLRDHWVARVQLESMLLGRMPQSRFGISGPGSGPVGTSIDANGSGGH